MSLHRVIAPPPLALAVHPAPATKTSEQLRKEAEEKQRQRQVQEKAREAKDKAKAEAKGAEGGFEVKPGGKAVDGTHEAAAGGPTPVGVDEPLTPLSPASDIPEPPTPASPAAAPNGDSPDAGQHKDKADPPKKAVKLDTKPVALDSAPPDTALPESPKKADSPPPPPLRLLPPVPFRPLRSRLDLNPSKPYPPINTDPRGAYHKYAKAVQMEGLYIDVTKDGWLVEQWKERTEREALARLTGEAENQRLREVAKAKAAKIVRKLPETADGLLLELWNDLVEAPANEVSVDAFWARYDWSEPDAKKHLQIMPEDEKEKARAAERIRVEAEAKAEEAAHLARRAQREKEKKEEAERKEKEKNGGQDVGEGKEWKQEEQGEKVKSDAAKEESKVKDEQNTAPNIGETDPDIAKNEIKVEETPKYQYTEPVEWTREGVEEILATVGIQCAYNTEKPLPRHWSSPAGAYLLLAHNHFLLRIESDIQFKPEGTSDKFEALVTTANDRVFGEMVQAQINAERKKREKEYRDRKEREYRERKREKEREEKKVEGKEQGKDGEKKGKDHKLPAKEKDVQERGEGKVKRDGENLKDDVADTPGTLLSDVKHLDGEVIRPANDTPIGKDLVVDAVPVKDNSPAKQDKDAQHEAEAKLVGPGEAAMDGTGKEGEKEANIKAGEKDVQADEAKKVEGKQEKAVDKPKQPHAAAPALAQPQHRDKRPVDPAAMDAELLIKLLGPEAANIPLAELKMAFAAMEAAAAESKARASALGGKKDGPVIWVWHEPCERWRWRNFAAGCAEIGDGGWEERDWRVFADDRGVEEFEDDMSWEESLETDIHDWSC